MKKGRKTFIYVLVALICAILLASTALIVYTCIENSNNSNSQDIDDGWTDAY